LGVLSHINYALRFDGIDQLYFAGCLHFNLFFCFHRYVNVIIVYRIKWESAVDRVDEAEVSWAEVVQVEAVEWETEEA
jgi:hypothetical protein